HVPIMILIELKDDRIPALPTLPTRFDESNIESVDKEIDSVFPLEEILTPDDVRADDSSLRESILKKGWPKLNEARGKVLFALDNEGRIRDNYLKNHETLQNRRMFVTPPHENHVSAAFFKINDPIRDFEKIQRLVGSGFLVRTRADADTRQSRSGETSQRDRAFASGAQFVSTDYPEPRPEFSDYQVRHPNHAVALPNPVSAAAYTRKELE
ncbi:MAG: hypothetical protein RJA81_628, partial [Planctomycetota bacterium]